MKTIIIILTTFILSSFCKSQEKQDNSQNNGYLVFSGGASFPSGQFSEASSLAAAKDGVYFSILFEKPEFNNFGYIASAFSQIIPIDKESIATYYGTKNSGTWTVDGKNWVTGGAMVGGYVFYPFDAKNILSIEARVMIGGIYISMPDVTYKQTGTTRTDELTGGIGGSFAYQLGTGFRINASTSICFMINFDFIGSTFNYEAFSGSSNIGQIYNVEKSSQPVNTLNLSFGVGFIL